jgi:hypothetical protein
MNGPSGSGPSPPFPDDADADGADDADDDEAVLRALAGAVALADPAPADWQQAALVCFDWLALDARLAELAYDSLDDLRPAGTAQQEGSERRRLRFGSPGLAIEVELSVTADAVRLGGRLLPAGRRWVRALVSQAPSTAVLTAEVGDSGAFRFDDLPNGPVSLLVDDGPAVKTGWIVP